MSPYIRAYVHGTITVIIGCVLAYLMVLARQYEVSRFMVILVPLLGSLVAALAAPRRRFVVGVSLLPVVGAAMFALVFAWNAVVTSPTFDEGVAGAAHDVRGMSPFWTSACVVGAAIGWVTKLRSATPPNTSLERMRER
jgi:hypothetical protein